MNSEDFDRNLSIPQSQSEVKSEQQQPTPAASDFEVGSFGAELWRYADQRFTGKLSITTTGGDRWQLYLHLGNLVWATGGRHPVRRWRRCIQRYCPKLNLKRLALRKVDEIESWDYHIIWLLALRQVAPAETVYAILRISIAEVLFDIVRAIALAEAAAEPEINGPQFCIAAETGIRPSKIGMLPQQAMVNVLLLLKHVHLQWQNWVTQGLTRCSPDFIPVIGDRRELQATVAPAVFSKLTSLIDGKRSLRDIAVIAKKDPLAVARSLIPYLRTQTIALVKGGDLPLPLVSPPPPPPTVAPPRPAYKPLIACIDDDAQVRQLLEGIVAEKGYRFLDVSDPVQALPMLLQQKPDLIVLDLVMPVANGYEICSQLRRVTQFRETPIIILTGNDGIVDRVRAKVVGATDFLSKPIDIDKTLALLEKYCPQVSA